MVKAFYFHYKRFQGHPSPQVLIGVYGQGYLSTFWLQVTHFLTVGPNLLGVGG